MPTAVIAAPVASFLVAGGASAATASLVGAAVAGVVYGAVIGAATSLISGRNVLKGALLGAAIGGVSAGVIQGVSPTDFIGTAAAGTGVEAPVGEAGLEAAQGGHLAGPSGMEPGATVGTAVTAPRPGGVGETTIADMAPDPGVKAATTAQKGMSPSAANLWGGVISGVGKGIGEIMKAERAKDILETERKYEIDRVDRNVAARVPTRTVTDMKLPQRWQQLTNVSADLEKYKTPGLLQR